MRGKGRGKFPQGSLSDVFEASLMFNESKSNREELELPSLTGIIIGLTTACTEAEVVNPVGSGRMKLPLDLKRFLKRFAFEIVSVSCI